MCFGADHRSRAAPGRAGGHSSCEGPVSKISRALTTEERQFSGPQGEFVEDYERAPSLSCACAPVPASILSRTLITALIKLIV